MSDIFKAQAYLQDFGIKPSLQRIAIVDYLMNHRIHPTADEIYNALYLSVPTLSRTTIYNTMKLFVEQGAVLSLMIDDKHVHYDIDTSYHAHFQCIGCDKIFDIPVTNPILPDSERFGELEVTEVHLYYKGYCPQCKKKTVDCH